jgi:hypothetical protein
MQYRLPSYDNLHGDCYSSSPEEPCWGATSEDELDIVMCEAHSEDWYNPSPYDCDKGEEPNIEP